MLKPYPYFFCKNKVVFIKMYSNNYNRIKIYYTNKRSFKSFNNLSNGRIKYFICLIICKQIGQMFIYICF